jgi:putative ABC transport system substrate-binding protein
MVPVIGYLGTQSADDDYKNLTVPFLQGLKESGYVEGQNVAIEYRWAENQYDRLSPLAADLVRRRVAVIVANETPAAHVYLRRRDHAAKQAAENEPFGPRELERRGQL